MFSETEQEIARVQQLKDGELDKALKVAIEEREQLSKDLVQSTSEFSNQEKAKDAEVAALESIKKVRFVGSCVRLWSLLLFIEHNTMSNYSIPHALFHLFSPEKCTCTTES